MKTLLKGAWHIPCAADGARGFVRIPVHCCGPQRSTRARQEQQARKITADNQNCCENIHCLTHLPKLVLQQGTGTLE